MGEWMNTKTKIAITISVIGFLGVCFSFFASPGWVNAIRPYWEIPYLTVQYIVNNAGKIITSPGCLGMIFLLVMVVGLQLLSPEKRKKEIEKAKQGIDSVRSSITKIVVPKRLAHRPPKDDDKAIRLIREKGYSYRKAYDELYPPTKGDEELRRLEEFDKRWRSRVSKKVNALDRKFDVKN